MGGVQETQIPVGSSWTAVRPVGGEATGGGRGGGEREREGRWKEEEVGRINVREENNVTASASPMHNK